MLGSQEQLQPVAPLCPHCNSQVEAGGHFCPVCGLAIPPPIRTAPRIVHINDMAATPLGRELQIENAAKQATKAAAPLLFVAVIQFVMAMVLVGMLLAGPESALPKSEQFQQFLKPVVVGFVIGIGFIFLLLYLWARKNPFPAAIVGLVFYITVHLLDVLADPKSIFRGALLKIIVITLLVKAIAAGARHRRLIGGVVAK